MSQPILFGSWAPGQLAAELAAVRATQEQASAGTASPAAEESGVVEQPEASEAAASGPASPEPVEPGSREQPAPAAASPEKKKGTWADRARTEPAPAAVPRAGPSPSTSTQRAPSVLVVVPPAVVAHNVLNGGVSNGTPAAAREERLSSTLLELGRGAASRPLPPYQPRPLRNSGNVCYLNATIQALLACPPFQSLIAALRASAEFREERRRDDANGRWQSQVSPQPPQPLQQPLRRDLPTLSCLAALAAELRLGEAPNSRHHSRQDGVVAADALFSTVLSRFSETFGATAFSRRQEDCQEFFSFLLDQAHEELLRLEVQGGEGPTGEEAAERGAAGEEWDTVIRGQKSAVVRSTGLVEASSWITEHFGGSLQSSVKGVGKKASITLEAFRLLSLEICADEISSVDEALKHMCRSELLQDYKTDNGDSTSAQKSLSIHNAPQILVIHLKRFEWASTKNHGRKLAKPIRFPECLTLPQNVYPAAMLAANSVEREYTLRSVVHHIGATLEGGHYVADVRVGDSWLRVSDANVGPRTARDLEDGETTAYLLLFSKDPVKPTAA